MSALRSRFAASGNIAARAEPKTAEAPIQPTSTPLNVLVVDDHPANRLLMCQQLEFLGHHFSAAADGAAGLEAWKHGLFDLVIVDCNMPLMNGYELTRADSPARTATAARALHGAGFHRQCATRGNTTLQTGRDGRLPVQTLEPEALRQWVDGITPIARAPAFSLEGLNC